jgi:hypothetical protein
MANCDMRVEDPFPFAWCETHDETFPLGGICPETRRKREGEAIAARARGDFDAERKALDSIALDDRARSGGQTNGD